MEYSIPWIEKYRPSSVKDIVLNEETRKHVNIFMEDIQNTHFIITGPPGIGKTTTVRCIARETLGENLAAGYLELNAAEDRGIRSIASIIPPFCKKLVNFKQSRIILLDEADNMTTKCQYDINDMMRQYGSNIKFIFTCNDSTKIIEDIQSVCKIARFKPLNSDQIKQYISHICECEGLTINKVGLETICYVSGGDMRKAINNLQMTAFSFDNINKTNILKICKVPDPENIKEVLDLCEKGNLVEANKSIEHMIFNGYYYTDIVNGIIYVVTNHSYSEELKLKIINIVNQTLIAISCGLRSTLQLTALLARLTRLFNLETQNKISKSKSNSKSNSKFNSKSNSKPNSKSNSKPNKT